MHTILCLLRLISDFFFSKSLTINLHVSQWHKYRIFFPVFPAASALCAAFFLNTWFGSKTLAWSPAQEHSTEHIKICLKCWFYADMGFETAFKGNWFTDLHFNSAVMNLLKKKFFLNFRKFKKFQSSDENHSSFQQMTNIFSSDIMQLSFGK